MSDIVRKVKAIVVVARVDEMRCVKQRELHKRLGLHLTPLKRR
jgi:hypothetical protein